MNNYFKAVINMLCSFHYEMQEKIFHGFKNVKIIEMMILK